MKIVTSGSGRKYQKTAKGWKQVAGPKVFPSHSPESSRKSQLKEMRAARARVKKARAKRLKSKR